MQWLAPLDPGLLVAGIALIGVVLALPFFVASFRRLRHLKLVGGTLYFLVGGILVLIGVAAGLVATNLVTYARLTHEQEAARMGVLVEDLLTLARLDEVREPVREEVDLGRLADDAVDDARATAPDRDIERRAEGYVRLSGDPAQLRQVLGNLVRNALVHTPPGTPIEVATRRDGTLYCGQVHHTPYPLHQASYTGLSQSLLQASGFHVDGLPTLPAYYSPGVDVEVFALFKV